MKPMLVYPVGATEAVKNAVRILHKQGIAIIDHPAPEITHLMLDIPSFSPDGMLRDGSAVEMVLERLPEDVTIAGGNLFHPALGGYRTLDLLKDSVYLAHNAAITAACALQVAAPLLKSTLRDTPTLVIGWGRIGKCLARLLKQIGADVTVAARKEQDRAMLQALGYRAVEINSALSPYRLVFNTVPAELNMKAPGDCVKIDLASRQGLVGADVVRANGLPAKYAPESSGALIAKTFLKLCKEESS